MLNEHSVPLQIAKLKGSWQIPPINGPPSHVPIRDLLFNKAVHKEELCVAKNTKTQMLYRLHAFLLDVKKFRILPQIRCFNYSVLGREEGRRIKVANAHSSDFIDLFAYSHWVYHGHSGHVAWRRNHF